MVGAHRNQSGRVLERSDPGRSVRVDWRGGPGDREVIPVASPDDTP